jgi:dienelactone hydrolase
MIGVMAAGLSAQPTPTFAGPALPGTALLTEQADFSAEMRGRLRVFFQRQIDDSIAGRAGRWKRDFASREAYEKSVAPNRERLRTIVGAVDARVGVGDGPELIATVGGRAPELAMPAYTVRAVRWAVFPGVWAEGLLLEPDGAVRARIVALPDADQTPEELAGLVSGGAAGEPWAARLAASGCQVLVPTLIDRSDEFSGSPAVTFTNQPHREWIWRQAYQLGRHLIGYEVQKVQAAVDWFEQVGSERLPIGVAGYAEGGAIALHAAALDPRIDAALVSGYFDSRQGIAEEPIYRDVFGLLTEFGDAEIASLVAPRGLVLEHSTPPAVSGPPALRSGRRLAGALGRITTPELASMRREVARAEAFFAGQTIVQPRISVVAGEAGAPLPAGSGAALGALLERLGVKTLAPAVRAPAGATLDVAAVRERQRRQVAQLVEHTQALMRASAAAREKYWAAAKPASAAAWPGATARLRAEMWDNLIGRYPAPVVPPRARTRRIADEARFAVYEVLLDVDGGLFAWGQFLLPKDLRPGERRPVVVCQHGLEGVPADVVTTDATSRAYAVYQGFAARLAERGFITYAPHNYYRGGNEFRLLQRLAHPVGKTLFAATTVQHQQVLRWLSSLAFVDPQRIGFYGLSYGGNTAVRVPALLEQYAVVIASGDFNEWVYKNVTVDHIHSMMYNNVWEVYEWNLGHTFNHAEMAALIAPRPFMVERGHDDGVARDEWVAGEYAKVRRLYAKLGLAERTEIEFFDGPHRINGVGTYAFLHRHLNWPEPKR